MHEFHGSRAKPKRAMGEAKNIYKWISFNIFTRAVGKRGWKRYLDVGISSQSGCEI